MSYTERKAILQKVEAARGSKAMLFVTGDRPGMETQISPEIIDFFVDHLDALWPAEKISLILHTNGGNTAAAWRLVNLLRTFCEELEIIIPAKAMSAGTLMCLGADKIVMTKQATLGPIDPSLNGPLNPMINGMPNQRVPVSVEAIQGYIDVVREKLEITDPQPLANIWSNLSSQIHPLVLGQIFRSRQQIHDLATKLLKYQSTPAKDVKKIVSFLCSESGSHDHSINRREAKELGLDIDKPSEEFYSVLRELEKEYRDYLKLRDQFNPDTELGTSNEVAYEIPRALIESVNFGSHEFVSRGRLKRVQLQGPVPAQQTGIEDARQFEGWQLKEKN
ncbi:hypothetical protein [Erythrobacter sp.]|uniref:SDH family Clp fold serine proteinase n=1 Tax=Erythrobacter sp. TaxID=1042 RepID=UPI0031204FA2